MLTVLDLPSELSPRNGANGAITLRRADAADVPRLMSLLADDPISAGRGDVAADSDLPAYLGALSRIRADDANELVVAVDNRGNLVGMLQLTVIPGLSRRGSTRLLVEAVRVAADRRSAGIGGAMMRWVTDSAAPALQANLVQLTSDAARADAHRFYERLGFTGSHVGFKYTVPAAEG